MEADEVVPALDVRRTPWFDDAEAGHAGFGLRGGPAAVQQLALQRGEEALAHGVVVGVTDAVGGRTLASLHRVPNARNIYWHPWSLWWIASPGWR